jgi:hypothetical protein
LILGQYFFKHFTGGLVPIQPLLYLDCRVDRSHSGGRGVA